MTDIGEMKAAIAHAGEDLPLPVLQNAVGILDEQRSRLAEVLTGTGNDDAKTALAAFATATESIRLALEAHRSARSQCEEYVNFA